MAEAGEMGGRAKVRVVRCPKCDKLLPELANFTVYRCGGCNATLQAKKQSPLLDASLEKPDGGTAKSCEDEVNCEEKRGVVVDSDASSELDPKREKVELRREKKKVLSNDSPISHNSSADRTENMDDLKELDAPTSDGLPLESGHVNRDNKYGRSSKAPIDVTNTNVNDMVKAKVEGDQEAKVQFEYSNGYHRVERDELEDRISAIHRGSRPMMGGNQPASYPEEGPSDYHPNPPKRQNVNGQSSAEYLDQDRAELLRKLDELRDQLRRSCEVADKPKDRVPPNHTTFSLNSHDRCGRGNWFPEGLSSLNRASSRHSPFMNGHSMDFPNLYPTLHPQNGAHGCREAFGPHSLGRPPFHPPGQYPPRPMSNCLYGQFDPDPLVSYHHDGFYHQPACSCLHCYNSHWPTSYSNQRAPYPVTNPGFYPVDASSMFGPHIYNPRDASVSLHSHEPRSRQRGMISRKDGQSCRPVAGAAPFVSCYNCFELLQLPEDILGMGTNQHKLRCGSCSHLISFELNGRRLIASAPPTKDVIPENDNNSNDGLHGHMNGLTATSYSGDFDSQGYDVHSADEKLVLQSFPASSDKMVEKEYGFHSTSGKIQGLSSSPSMSEDESPDSMVCQRDVPSSTELPLEAEGISRVPSLPLREHFGYPSSDQVVDGPGNGSRSKRSDQEKIVSMNGNFKQNSIKDVTVATEMDLSADEYPDAGLSQDSWEVTKDEDQPRGRNSKGGESFFAGLIKKSFRDFSRFNQSMESGRCKVSINGHPISDRLVKKAEKLAGAVHPGDYWYDYRAGFWGALGHACLGIIPPFIEEFNYPMPKNCAGGNTGVLINGRELHQKDLALLAGRGLPITEGRSYIVEISGKVWDEASGEELDSLGKLAPTVEKVRHGFGMRIPRVIA